MTREELLQVAKPILFNTDMVRAILDGRKTVTRRCVKFLNGKNPNWTGYVKDGLMLYNGTNEPCIKPCLYQPGDILYVRETWQECCRHIVHSPITHCKYCYKASNESAFYGCIEECGEICNWRPSIHMPKEAARIFLKVKEVRVERLQDIMKDPSGPNNQVVREGCTYGCDFIATWNSTIRKSDLDRYGWDASPWVWVIEFEMVETK